MSTLLIQIRSGTMMNMDTNVLVKLSQAALDQGHKVKVFAYGEGITTLKDGQDPKRFPNVGEILKEQIPQGLSLVACETCCYARGIKRGEEFEGSKIGSLTNDLSVFIADCDRMVTSAR
ncbi:MAG TPA: sulfur reduction protein DsrE [Candidatus Methanomethylophilaceae archaeon]|nr:sulfur reduction protein DsrE [Candidatus Methanomethylophilaceae archaeon]